MPARSVVAGRSRRGVRPLWARRWGARMSRGYGGRRWARSLVRRMRSAGTGRLQDGRPPLGMRRALEPAVPPGVNKAFGTPRTAGSVETAMNPGAVWVNGAVGEPEVIGPAGSVWVTRSGQEEPEDSSPPSCERNGRPGTLGHESILELWLKVQAMRVASGCWEGSRVELHPVPAGEGPVEKGVPGRASWIETSRDGVTGPWVRGHTRAFPRASGLPSARGIGASCERPSIFCRQGQAGKPPPAVGGPGVVEKIGSAASGPWKDRQTMGVPVAIGWSEAVKTSRAGDVTGCGDVRRGGQSVQVSGALAEAVYGPMLWERGQIVGPPDALMALPRTVEDETSSQGATGLWQRRQEMENIGSRGIPGLGAMGQSVGVPCARVEGARCGGDPGSWGAAQAAELSASEEQEAGSRGAQGLWGIEQAMGAPRALGKEADNASVPGLWGTGQLPGLQPVVLSEDKGEETSHDVSGLWERQQAMRTPLAEALPGPVMEETHGGSLLSLWEREQVMREQEAQGPAALGVAGAMDQGDSCGALLCPCGRGRAVVMPKHMCAPERVVPSTLGIPDALWVCQESSSADALNLRERALAAFGRPVAPEEGLSVVENAESGPLSGSRGRRQAVGVPEIPGYLETEAGSRGFLGLSGRSVGIPVTAEVSAAGVGMAPRTSSSVWEYINSRRVSESAESNPPTGISVTVGLPEAMGDETLAEGLQRRQSASMPVATRIATAVGEPPASGLFGPYRVVDSACGERSGAWQRRLRTDLSTAARVPKLEMEAGSESVSDLWRRHSGTVPEVVRGALHQGMLAAAGAPVVGGVPAAVWVTGSPGEEASGGVSDLVRRQSTEGGRASGEETGSRGILGLSGRGQTVGTSYSHELGARMWGGPRSVGEEITHENIPGVSAMRTPVPSVSREETGPGHFRDILQGNGGRATGVAHEARVRANDLGERREGGLRGTFQ
ncbi:collagen alpha-1(III) chain [Alexandromys fortis]|uniref:collagen alpha-1(III) chain n=1 Tax=Alexandromys fortis TaxID=100897 RepID=UPI0021535AB4|nr:collagen alpha-1(III) chain [Microtus fortis]